MKNILIIFLGLLLMTSCKKESPQIVVIIPSQVTNVDVVLSPVLGLDTLKLNGSTPFLVIGSYRVENYGNVPIKIAGLKLEIVDTMSAVSRFWYRRVGSVDTLVLDSTNNYTIPINQTLYPGQKSSDFNIWAAFRYSSIYANKKAHLEVKVKSIITNLGNFTPKVNTLIAITTVP